MIATALAAKKEVVESVEGVTVVIPAYNYAHYLGEAIASVLAQSHQRFEIVVVDDGSTDQTREIVAQFHDTRVRYLWQANAGLSAARNAGIRAARFDYVAFLDADDRWDAQFLERVMGRFATLNEHYTFVAADIAKIDSKGLLLPANRHAVTSGAWTGELGARHFCMRNRPLSSSVVVRRSAFEEFGYFDCELRSSEDRDMWIRLTDTRRAWFIHEPLVAVRRHDSNMSRNAARMQRNSGIVLHRAWKNGVVTRWNAPFWMRVFSVHCFQSAWTHHTQGFTARALCLLIYSVLLWPLFTRPSLIWEPPLFRLRALRHFLIATLRHSIAK